MGNNEPAVDQSDLRIRGSYGLNHWTCIYTLDMYLYTGHVSIHWTCIYTLDMICHKFMHGYQYSSTLYMSVDL